MLSRRFVFRLVTLVVALTTTMASAGQEAGAEKSAVKKSAEKKSAAKKAPNFKLSDQNGKVRSLQEFTKKGPVALIFYRSADW